MVRAFCCLWACFALFGLSQANALPVALSGKTSGQGYAFGQIDPRFPGDCYVLTASSVAGAIGSTMKMAGYDRTSDEVLVIAADPAVGLALLKKKTSGWSNNCRSGSKPVQPITALLSSLPAGMKLRSTSIPLNKLWLDLVDENARGLESRKSLSAPTVVTDEILLLEKLACGRLVHTCVGAAAWIGADSGDFAEQIRNGSPPVPYGYFMGTVVKTQGNSLVVVRPEIVAEFFYSALFSPVPEIAVLPPAVQIVKRLPGAIKPAASQNPDFLPVPKADSVVLWLDLGDRDSVPMSLSIAYRPELAKNLRGQDPEDTRPQTKVAFATSQYRPSSFVDELLEVSAMRWLGGRCKESDEITAPDKKPPNGPLVCEVQREVVARGLRVEVWHPDQVRSVTIEFTPE